MNFDMKNFLRALSLALDLAEIDYFKVNLNHSRRTAYISMMIARNLNLSEEKQCDLFALSILHDNGVSISAIKNFGKEFETMPGHCIEGEKKLEKFPLITKPKNVITYHHENFDGTGIFKLGGSDIPFFSQIIHIADSLDTEFNLDKIPFTERKTVRKYLLDNSNKMFNPLLVEALLDIIMKDRFWSDLAFYNIDEILERITPPITYYDYNWDEIIELTEVFMEIIDSKSKFTYSHSRGITDKIGIMSSYYNLCYEKKKKLQIAANLHDLGKLYVPNEILDKPGALDEHEFHEIRQHTYFTKLALEKISGFEDIANWAANHHEKLNGLGYPERLKANELDFESRLLGIIDIYQALTEDRPYRKGLEHTEVVGIMNKMVSGGFIDGDIVGGVAKVMKEQ